MQDAEDFDDDAPAAVPPLPERIAQLQANIARLKQILADRLALRAWFVAYNERRAARRLRVQQRRLLAVRPRMQQLFDDKSREIVAQQSALYPDAPSGMPDISVQKSLGMLQFLLEQQGGQAALTAAQLELVREKQSAVYDQLRRLFTTVNPDTNYLERLVRVKALDRREADRIRAEFTLANFAAWSALPWDARAKTIATLSGYTERGLELFYQHAFEQSNMGWLLQGAVNLSNTVLLAFAGSRGSWENIAIHIALNNTGQIASFIGTTLGMLRLNAQAWSAAYAKVGDIVKTVGRFIPGYGWMPNMGVVDALQQGQDANAARAAEWGGYAQGAREYPDRLADKAGVSGWIGAIRRVANLGDAVFGTIASIAGSFINMNMLTQVGVGLPLALLGLGSAAAMFTFWPMVAAVAWQAGDYALGTLVGPTAIALGGRLVGAGVKRALSFAHDVAVDKFGRLAILTAVLVGGPVMVATVSACPLLWPPVIGMAVVASMVVGSQFPVVAQFLGANLLGPLGGALAQNYLLSRGGALVKSLSFSALGFLRSGVTRALLQRLRSSPQNRLTRAAIRFLSVYRHHIDAVLYLVMVASVLYYSAPLLVLYHTTMRRALGMPPLGAPAQFGPELPPMQGRQLPLPFPERLQKWLKSKYVPQQPLQAQAPSPTITAGPLIPQTIKGVYGDDVSVAPFTEPLPLQIAEILA